MSKHDHTHTANVGDAVEMMENFRGEANEILNRYFSVSYSKLEVGSPASSCAMLIALGIANSHMAVVSASTGLTLDTFEVRQQHLFNGAVLYSLLAHAKSQGEFDAAHQEFAIVYREIGYGKGITTQMHSIIEDGFNLGCLGRASRENPENDNILESLEDSFKELSEKLNELHGV